ncbi:pyridoxal phosphate-dependent aminotransferase [Amycolatopsis sp. NPDC054798]
MIAAVQGKNRSQTVFSSRRAEKLRGSALAELYSMARRIGAVDLAVGSPAYPDTPPALLHEAARMLFGPHNQYEDPRGNLRLREEIARGFAVQTDAETEVTVTAGATEALCVALFAVVDPGDEVVLLEPFYEIFADAVALAGGTPRIVRLRPGDWSWDPGELAAAFGPRTRAVMLNSPSNPTGRMFTAEELDEIGTHVERWGVTVISDECYAGLTFDGREHVSAADRLSLRQHSIVVGSLSKNLAISGWRVGYLRADAERTAVLRRVHEVTTNGTAAPLQRAVGSSGILGSSEWDPAAGLAQRRDLVQQMLRDLGLTFRPADGGCFVFADISDATELDSPAYCRQLLDHNGVLVVPGTAFFSDLDRGRRYVRVAFNRSLQTIRAASEQLSGKE